MTDTPAGTVDALPISSRRREVALSQQALIAAVLDVLESGHAYEASTLHALFPNTSMDSLREALHALWVDRRVERAGASGWRRHESRPDATASPAGL